MNPTPHFYTISAERPFLKTLAAWVLAEYGKDAAKLVQTLILLPNRRACRSLREAFLEESGGKALLLPRIQPIGDFEEEELLVSDALTADIPGSISPVKRRLLLTQLVMNFEKNAGRPYDVAQAAELARKLIQFIDEVERDGLDLENLASLVPEELAMHWQQTLDFLAIVSTHWPKILEGEGALEPVARRNRVLAAVAESWRKTPPAHPIIAAGSTGSQPATARLLSVIARLPQGKVILPALDQTMQEPEWGMVSHTHPQYGLKQLLERAGIERQQVQPLVNDKASARKEVLSAMFAPAEATAQWLSAKLSLDEGLKGIRLIEADTPLDEARIVAVALREVLESPARTAALVTPDRTLARMVAGQMKRYGVSVDDSAGRSLLHTPGGAYLRLIVEVMASRAAPVAVLSLLRHPLAAGERDTAECRQLSRVLEEQLLRGVRKTPGLKSLRDAAAMHSQKHAELVRFLDQLAKAGEGLSKLFAKKSVPFTEILAAHLAFAEWLATTEREPGAERLWAGDAGNQLASYFAELMDQAGQLGSISPSSYSGLFDSLLSEPVYRPAYGTHPRLHILSPMEARLQQYDLVILSGLNEGSWPALPNADPWMSRPMRHAFGLPSPESSIGLSAHDFYLALACPDVLLTRARKVDGVPTVASRWLVRLKTLVAGKDPEAFARLSASATRYEQAVAAMDAPIALDAIPIPDPKPPVEARPRQLRVTAIDTWLRDPYALYAKSVLRLDALDDLDKEPGAADFGVVIHNALERFIRTYPKDLPQDAQAQLIACGKEAFEKFIDRPAVAALWWPRFEAMSSWLVDIETKRRKHLTSVHAELVGQWTFEVDGKAFTLTTRIDRLEVEKSGNVIIADYKTGTVPKPKDIERGLANQLPLEALIATEGTLMPETPKGAVTQLEYWKLAGNKEDCAITQILSDNAAEMEQARERLVALIRKFDDTQVGYAAQTNPALALRYNDYEHLTRAQEWETV